MMSVFDLLVLAVLALSVLVSMMRGVVAEITSLITWIVALLAARLLSPILSQSLFTRVDSEIFAMVLAFIVVFVTTYFLLKISEKLLTSAVKAAGLGGLNKFFGAVFGLVKGLCIITVVVVLCAFTDLPRSEDWRKAYTSEMFQQLASLTVPYLPAFVAGRIDYSIPSE
ncbi:colicin V production protein CvpA [Vitreoscilla sp. C1]|uniref:CvpA family protein n=1 Tax=Vitreoscilla sp. (strain C1) TaxID=96942 RepID=UPI00148EA6A6|nr:CvpA family protein [Vitreoscilla sp. C1]QJQ52123.1 colicin V production protein CvpA [Vitreoscilla sp. C1]